MKNDTAKAHLIEGLSAAMEALASVVGQNIEVVLHDLQQPDSSVLKIINGHLSGRVPGSSLLDGPENDMGFMGILNHKSSAQDTGPAIFTDYKTVSLQGKPLRSATVLFKDESGKASLSLCFNADDSAINAARDALTLLLPPGVEAKESGETGLEEKMDEIIHDCLPPTGQLRTGATKKEKVEIVRKMQEKGMFIVRGGVEKAAKVLGVTRYTVYNYLDEIKKEGKAG
ncbi:PAS domain-containing protein [Brenneria populi subsp. brevivirga]|uniref:helix-turn-helix transcriptional regulator n=1 Tax=Brenneria populi TaxID=1505588 RepID=UPI002E192A7F|nr:PAS domain-containing protein [Brenneria populi subsp. brevivirga]